MADVRASSTGAAAEGPSPSVRCTTSPPASRDTLAAAGGDDVTRCFICPLTLAVMKDPVMDYDGSSYERHAIVEWLSKHSTSPVTRNPLVVKHLVPNRALRDAIYQHMGEEWAREAESELKPIPADLQPGQPNGQIPAPAASNTDYRGIIDSFLEVISRSIQKDIRLNASGICAFTYEILTIVIEVPERVGTFFIYTTLLDVGSFEAHKDKLMETLLRMNYLQQETRGGCLALDPMSSEVTFSYSDRCAEVNAADFRNILENFIDTALKVNTELRETLAKEDRRLSPK